MNYDDIEQLVQYVNDNLNNGGSVSKVERDLGFGKDTIRKKLNRASYRYDKLLKQFVLKDNTDITQEKAKVIKIENTEVKKENVLQANTSKTHKKERKVTQDNTDITQTFSKEEINILKGIIKNYKSLEVERVELKGKVTTRSFRTYETVLDKFVKYCIDNKLIQKDAIAQAMLDFMNKEN